VSRALRSTLLGLALLGAAVGGAWVYDRYGRAPAPALPGAPAATAGAAATAVHVPAELPAFALKDPAGHLHASSEWHGKALLVNFWATWCAPCRREIPLLNRIRHEYAAQGVEVIGIAVDFVEDVVAYQQRFAIDYPLLVGEQEGLDAARAFGVDAPVFPFTAFTDSAGRILTVHLGELHEDQARAILAVIRQIDRGALSPEAAREAVRAALAALPQQAVAPAG
jgi:thiol-disulfide isomerase/thioredoxin